MRQQQNRIAACRWSRLSTWQRGIHHRRDDLAVAGAAAEHAAQRLLDFCFDRLDSFRAARCRHQHAGRADAALRRAVLEECACSADSLPLARPSTVRHRAPALRPPASGRRRPVPRRAAPCRRRNRRRRSRPWCRSAATPRAAPPTDGAPAAPDGDGRAVDLEVDVARSRAHAGQPRSARRASALALRPLRAAPASAGDDLARRVLPIVGAAADVADRRKLGDRSDCDRSRRAHGWQAGRQAGFDAGQTFAPPPSRRRRRSPRRRRCHPRQPRRAATMAMEMTR